MQIFEDVQYKPSSAGSPSFSLFLCLTLVSLAARAALRFSLILSPLLLSSRVWC